MPHSTAPRAPWPPGPRRPEPSNRLSRAVAIPAAILLLVAGPASSALAVPVLASGNGPTVEAATRRAIRAAVEQQAGLLVSSMTLMKNYEVVEDTVSAFAQGNVSDYRILKQVTSREGDVEVTVEANVEPRDLGIRLSRLSDGHLDGIQVATLLSQAETRDEDITRGVQNWCRLAQDNLSLLLTSATLSQPTIQSKDPDTVEFRFTCRLQRNARFFESLRSLFQVLGGAIPPTRRDEIEGELAATLARRLALVLTDGHDHLIAGVGVLDNPYGVEWGEKDPVQSRRRFSVKQLSRGIEGIVGPPAGPPGHDAPLELLATLEVARKNVPLISGYRLMLIPEGACPGGEEVLIRYGALYDPSAPKGKNSP